MTPRQVIKYVNAAHANVDAAKSLAELEAALAEGRSTMDALLTCLVFSRDDWRVTTRSLERLAKQRRAELSGGAK